MSTKDALVAELEPLTHHDRTRRLVQEGMRAAAGDAEIGGVIDELWRSPEAYERLIALTSARGSRDGARVVEALSDPSRSVRRAASRMVAQLCDDAQAGAALEAIVERRMLRRTAAALVRRGRRGPVDAFLAARMRRGKEALIVDLLPLGSEGLVAGFMHDIEQGGGATVWQRLASRHPAFMARWFRNEIARSKSLDGRQRYRLWPHLEGLARHAPDAALALVQALFDAGQEPSWLAGPLGRLVRSRPREAFDLLKARHEGGRPTRPPGAFGVVRFDKVARELGAERLDYLIRHAWGTLGDGRRGVRWFLRLSDDDKKAVLRAFLLGGRGGWGAFLFRYLKADAADERALRDAAFERWGRAAQAADGTIAPEVLDFLPRDLREREARRHLHDCPALASKPERRIVYARLLAFDEAKQVLAPFLGHPEGEERARAQGVLIASVRHDRGAVGAALANVKARKFEQDPVRRVMIEALAALPHCFRAEHLEAAGGVIRDALDAADLSPATAAAVERWVARLFRVDGAWGARWLGELLAVRGTVSTWGLGAGLTRAEAERLSPALETLADTWATRERAGAVINLAQSLGIRLAVVTPLLDALERLARELPFVGVAAAALDLLGEHDRPRFARLVPALLAEDQSFILLSRAARFVSLKRQDLLGGLLESKPMTGRFATGRSHWVVSFEVGFGRWTARQQRAYAAALCGLLRDDARDTPTLRFALTTLVRLPFADAALVLPFASDPRQPVREMAIRGLPWLDAGQGVPTLIEALGDDRARWAIYALRKAFAEMRRERVLANLRAVPTNKVTVAKEVVRLLGELGGDDAYRDLLALDRPGAHRDVRIALLRALWDHLEAKETWAVFERAVNDPDWIVASKLADLPLARLSGEAESRAVALLATILGRPEPEARLDLLKRAAALPLRDLERALFKRLLAHLDARAPDEAAAALAAALQRMLAAEAAVVSDRLKAFVPRRRHLAAFLPVVAAVLGPYARAAHVTVAEGLLKALGSEPRTAPQYLSLGARLWGWQDLGEALVDLSKKDLLYHDAMVAALEAVRSCAHPGALDELLQKQRDPRLRRLGLAALVEAASPQNGWTEARRARLGQYQNDPSPGVSGPAQVVFPPA
jgi:hypothetical protein